MLGTFIKNIIHSFICCYIIVVDSYSKSYGSDLVSQWTRTRLDWRLEPPNRLYRYYSRPIIVHLNWAQSSVKISPECINFSHKFQKIFWGGGTAPSPEPIIIMMGRRTPPPHIPTLRPLTQRLKSRPRSHFQKSAPMQAIQ